MSAKIQRMHTAQQAVTSNAYALQNLVDYRDLADKTTCILFVHYAACTESSRVLVVLGIVNSVTPLRSLLVCGGWS